MQAVRPLFRTLRNMQLVSSMAALGLNLIILRTTETAKLIITRVVVVLEGHNLQEVPPAVERDVIATAKQTVLITTSTIKHGRQIRALAMGDGPSAALLRRPSSHR